MGTRFSDSVNPNLTKNVGVRSVGQAATPDVWVSQDAVIQEWGFAKDDLWARLIDRHNELLNTGGIKASLWLQFDKGEACPCIKPETGQVDQRCRLCYGVRIVGGYEKYGHDTLLLWSGTPNSTLTDLVPSTSKRDHPIVLVDGKNSGTMLSPIFHVTNSFGFVGFDVVAQNSLRDLATTGIKIEYTLDGTTFLNLSTTTDGLNDPAIKVQFKITLTRPAGALSPFFTALRSRWKCLKDTQILVSKKMFPEQRLLESFGVQVNLAGITWWTTPTLGVPDGPIQKIGEDDFFELQEGFYTPQTAAEDEFPASGRFKPANVQFVEPNGRFLSQRFNIRNLQKDEPVISVF